MADTIVDKNSSPCCHGAGASRCCPTSCRARPVALPVRDILERNTSCPDWSWRRCKGSLRGLGRPEVGSCCLLYIPIKYWRLLNFTVYSLLLTHKTLDVDDLLGNSRLLFVNTLTNECFFSMALNSKSNICCRWKTSFFKALYWYGLSLKSMKKMKNNAKVRQSNHSYLTSVGK